MRGLRERRLQPEIMDRPGLEPDRHRAALRGLERINRWSASAAILWRPLVALARARGGPLRVLDVATGAGDLPRRLWRQARRAGLAMEFAACDVSTTAVNYARAAAAAGADEVRFFRCDALAEPLPDGFDAITCSLFLHHLAEADAVTLLRRMAGAARSLVLVNDLRRCRRGYWLAWAGTRLLSRSDVVHTDGPRSVEGAFTVEEVRALARDAGLEGAQVGRRWPFRLLLTWSRTPEEGQ